MPQKDKLMRFFPPWLFVLVETTFQILFHTLVTVKFSGGRVFNLFLSNSRNKAVIEKHHPVLENYFGSKYNEECSQRKH